MQLLFRCRFCREFARVSIACIIRRWWLRTNLQARTAFCADCTNGGFAFLASPFPQLPSHMYFALVQLLFRCRFCREFSRVSIACIIRRWWLRTNLQTRTAFCADCTNGGFAFLASPFPQLPSHMYFALVQLLFLCRFCREFSRVSIACIIRRWWLRTNLQARTALCADCTNVLFAYLASPFRQLPAHM